MDPSLTPLFSLAGRRALVTGASGGLGGHIARLLAGAGADVAVAARDSRKLAPLVAQLEALGVQARAVDLDVTQGASVTTCFEQLDAAGWSLDIVVNNAGVTVSKPLLQQTEDDWDHVLNTNLRGAFLVGKAAAARMGGTGRGGSIINVASILGERVAGAVAPYSASKAGLIQLTQSMALEWARHGVRCNALLPGYIVTDLNRDFLASEAGERLRSRVPTRRFGELDDLDGPVLLLASAAGQHMTGAAVAVDGGHLVSSL